LTALQIIELIAVVSGIIHVTLLTREKIIAWPFGLLTVSLYIYIFALSHLYSDMILHFVYVVLNLYGWWNWAHRNPQDESVEIIRLTEKEILACVAFILLGTAAWGYVMDNNTDADYAYGDAFTTVASLVAQFFLARKIFENWVIWIIVDVVAICIYTLKGLHPTAGLYLVYMGLCVVGLLGWRKTLALAAARTKEGQTQTVG